MDRDDPAGASDGDCEDAAASDGTGDGLDALELVSHPTRVAVLRALVEASRAGSPAVAFTDLRDAAGVEDTGRFNYHLNQLLGRYVHKIDGEYRLSGFGRRVVGPMLAGAYDTRRRPDPIPVEADCPACGRRLALRYADGTVDLACEDGHELLQGLSTVPATVADRPPEAARVVLGTLARQSVELAVEDVCPVCYGRVEAAITADVVPYAGDHLYVGRCRTCGNQVVLSVECCAVGHPRVAEFLFSRDVDLWHTPLWRVESFLPGGEERVGEDPLRVRTELAVDGDRLGVVLDREGSVVAVEA